MMSNLKPDKQNPLFPQPSTQAGSLLSNMVEFLLGKGLINPKDLEIAEYYQNKLENQGRDRSLLEILVELAIVDQNALNQVIEEATRRKSLQENAVASPSEQINTGRSDKQEEKLQLTQTIFDTLGYILGAPTQSELLNRFSRMIVDHFDVDCTLIFQLDDTTNSLVLTHSTHVIGTELEPHDFKVPIGSQSNISRSASTKQIIVSRNIPKTRSEPINHLIPETRYELCIPISTDDKVIGVLDLQSSNEAGLAADLMSPLQSIVSLVAPTLHHFQLLEATNKILNELSVLFQAQQYFSQAKTRSEIFNHLRKILNHFPFISELFILNGEQYNELTSSDNSITGNLRDSFIHFNGLSQTTIEEALQYQEYLIISEKSVPAGVSDEFVTVIKRVPCSVLAFIPIMEVKQTLGFVVIGSNQENAIHHQSVQRYLSLVKLVSAALTRLTDQEKLEVQLHTLQVVDLISQSISAETDLDKLYRVIHEQVIDVMGDVDFMIALYDPNIDKIEFPYAYEENHLLDIQPFSLGEGLTSILIQSKQPLMLVESAGKRASELGAKIIGSPAKSWLGVPLLVAGQVIGAMIVQDLHLEHRFDENDQHLLSTIANQIATTVRNARLISEAAQQTEMQSYAKEITNKLWSSTDIDSLLYTAINELGREFQAARGEIRLDISDTELPS